MNSLIRLELRRIRECARYFHLKYKLKHIHNTYGHAYIFIATPSHGNLGDHAIVYAQYKMIETIAPVDSIVEIYRYQYERWRASLQKLIIPDDIIVIDGGGNMGTLWLEEEYKMRDIVSRFNENKVFIFPQTVSYSGDSFGEEELEKAYQAYKSNKYLMIFARDEKSYDFLKRKMPEIKVALAPDMVMTLGNIGIKTNRSDVLICLRTDSEKAVSDDVERIVLDKAKELGQDCRYTSTVLEGTIWKNKREKTLMQKWEEFSGAKLIITDRLHGMVFAAITGTPCIALDNISHKVYGAYQWIKHLQYIRYCEDAEHIPLLMETLLHTKNTYYDIEPLIPFIDMLKMKVKGNSSE